MTSAHKLNSPASDRAYDSNEVGGPGKFSWEQLSKRALQRLERRLGNSSAARAGNQVSAERLAKLQALSQQLRLEESDSSTAKRVMFAGMSGIAASAIAHIVLIVVLAIVTLRMPSPPAGMAFEAAVSESVSEVVEMTQPVDANSPEPSETSEAIASEIEVSDQLDSISTQPLLETMGDIAAPSSSMANAMSATAASLPKSSASFFGAAAGGNCFCYVIDASGSMRGGPWEAARRELLKSLASLKPNQRFYIVMFTRKIEAISMPGEREAAERAMYATRENLEHARRWLMGVTIGGSGAAPKESVKFAIEKEPDAIYLLTDGVTKVKDVADYIRGQNRVSDLINGEQVRVPIHTIAFYSDQGLPLLRRIASENAGQFIYVPDPTK
ncbi:MAG: VWA domain-containing protein [Pirellulaceae bacterium]